MPGWFVTLAVAVIAGLMGAGGVVAYIRLRTVDEPTSRAGIEKTQADTRAVEVETLREALSTVREWAKEAYGRVTELNTQVVTLQASQDEMRTALDTLRTSAEEVRVLLAAHRQWDQLILTEIRKHSPDFPEPPPLLPAQRTS